MHTQAGTPTSGPRMAATRAALSSAVRASLQGERREHDSVGRGYQSNFYAPAEALRYTRGMPVVFMMEPHRSCLPSAVPTLACGACPS